MRREIVFGSGWLQVDVPENTFLVGQGISMPVPPGNLEEEVRTALDEPLDLSPLKDLARRARQAVVVFDDPTVPSFAGVWEAGIPAVIARLEEGGIPEERITLLVANALHRKFTHEEVAGIIGQDLVSRFRDRLLCHDAEDPEGIVRLGTTPSGWLVELNRLVAEADLVVYVNTSTTRGFSGGWKSICVGLSTYASIRQHHTPDLMSMSTERNPMHEILEEMGALVERELGKERFFKLETVLANPLQVHRILGGTVAATRRAALEIIRSRVPPRRALLEEKVDVVVYGVPDWSPYAAYSFTNPLLTLFSTGLGYLGGVIEALGKPGCTVVMATPCPFRWDEVHHASYREVWERVVPAVRDPLEARSRFEPEFAARPDYIRKYREAYSFHPVHALMALYPLKRLRHAGRVFVAGAEDPGVIRHAGFDPFPSVEEALAAAREIHGPSMTVALVENPPAINRS